MKGIIIKDILNLKQQGKIYLLFIFIYGCISFTNKDNSFISGILPLLCVLIPINAMAYDDKANWDKFALTMPLSKSDLVVSKYLLYLISATTAFIVSVIINSVTGNSLFDSLGLSLILVCAVTILISIILPVLFKFGIEKGRMIILLICLFPTIITLFISKLGDTNSSKAGSSPVWLTDELLLLAIPVVAIIIFFISIQISKSIYNHKEF